MPQLSPVLMIARPDALTSRCLLGSTDMKTCPSWLFGSIVGAMSRTLPSMSPAPTTLTLADLIDRELRQIGGRHLTDQIELVAGDDIEQGLALARGNRSDLGGRTADQSGHRRLNLDRSAFGTVEAGKSLSGGDTLSRIHKNLGDLQARPLRAHGRFVLRDQDSGHLDGRGEAGPGGFQDGNGCAVRGILLAGRQPLTRDDSRPEHNGDSDRLPCNVDVVRTQGFHRH